MFYSYEKAAEVVAVETTEIKAIELSAVLLQQTIPRAATLTTLRLAINNLSCLKLASAALKMDVGLAAALTTLDTRRAQVARAWWMSLFPVRGPQGPIVVAQKKQNRAVALRTKSIITLTLYVPVRIGNSSNFRASIVMSPLFLQTINRSPMSLSRNVQPFTHARRPATLFCSSRTKCSNLVMSFIALS